MAELEATSESASAGASNDTTGQVIVDDAPAYDAIISLCLVAQPRFVPRGDWRAWAETTASALSVEQWRRVRKWFAESAIGSALEALAPLLTGPAETRDLAALADAFAALPAGDMLRLVVTAELIAPQTPLDAPDLLALAGDLAAVRRFCDRYLRVTGRRRAVMLRTLAAPEEARAELVATLREFDTQVFAPLAPRLAEERQRAAQALRAQIARDGGAAPDFIRERDDLAGFSPVVIGVSTLLGDHLSAYFHDVDRTLFDGRDYEPIIVICGARKALGLGRRRGADALVGGAEGVERFANPAMRWAKVYAALADPSRLQIVRLLVERPRYGQELAAALGMSGATISHHLDALGKSGVLRIERRAHRTYFALDHEELRALLRQGEQYALGAPSDAQLERRPERQATAHATPTDEGIA